MNKASWELALQQSLGYHSLKCCATNTNYQHTSCTNMRYLLKSMHGGAPKVYTATRYLGLQSFDKSGRVTDLNESPYVWLSDLITAPKGFRIVDNNLAAKIEEHLSKKKALRKLITCLQATYEENFPAAILMLGAQVICTHYEALNEIASDGCVPATILHGDISHGKSLATKAGLSMLGIQNSHFLSSASNNRIIQVTSSTTLGVVLDDPSDVKEISEKILYHFERGISTTCKGTYTPRSTFISSVNKELLAKLVSLPPR